MDVGGDYDVGDGEGMFSECFMDDTLDPINRLAKYYATDFALQRAVLVRDLTTTCESAGYVESAKVVIPILSDFARDMDPGVRQMLVKQLPPLAKFFVDNGGDEGYEQLLHTFLPVGFELLVDKNIEVESFSLEMIQELAKLVRDEDVEGALLSVVITLGHDERAEDYRVVAAGLFNQLAFKFQLSSCVEKVLLELELLSSDSSFSVRKAVAMHLGGIAKVLSDDPNHASVVEIFLTLAADQVWGVREASLQTFEAISLSIKEPRQRAEYLLNPYQTLLDDDTRWVRITAYQYLGQFLYTLPAEDITDSILDMFLGMAFSKVPTEQQHMSMFCAYTFPAVLQAIGADRWPRARNAYANLLKDMQWKVRRTLAYSLHEIAILLGMKLTEESLVPALEDLLEDVDDVKIGAVLSIDRFLEVVSPQTREKLVPALCQVPLTSDNWRMRREVGQRMGTVSLLLTPGSVAFSSAVGLVLRLLDDSVMGVRVTLAKPAAMILKYMADSKAADLQSYLNTILSLAERRSFQDRQMFARVVQCAAEVGADYLVQSSLLDGLVQLSQDPVFNVLIVVERVLNSSFLNSPKWRDNPKVQLCVKHLNQRKDEEEEREMQAEIANG